MDRGYFYVVLAEQDSCTVNTTAYAVRLLGTMPQPEDIGAVELAMCRAARLARKHGAAVDMTIAAYTAGCVPSYTAARQLYRDRTITIIVQ